jgi:hypothetical protein
MNEDLIKASLQVAVPLWIERLKHSSFEYRNERGRICGDHIGEHGDIILYRGGKKGDSAFAFNRLAEGMAILAFQPGGVEAFDLHFEAKSDSPFERPR